MALEAEFLGHGGGITMRVDRYERAADEPASSDANWLTGGVELEVRGEGAFRAACLIAWTTDELASFYRNLRELLLSESLTGSAALETLENQVGLKVSLTSGRGTLSGFVRVHAFACLDFEDLETDQSYLSEGLGGLEKITSEFPAR